MEKCNKNVWVYPFTPSQSDNFEVLLPDYFLSGSATVYGMFSEEQDSMHFSGIFLVKKTDFEHSDGVREGVQDLLRTKCP